MLFTFTVVPVGGGDDLTTPVTQVVEKIGESGLPYQLTSAATLIEGDWSEVMPVLETCVTMLTSKYPRVYASITVDHHPGSEGRLAGAVEDVRNASGESVVAHP